MNNTKKVVKNFASLTAGEIFTRLCASLLFIYIARVLGVTSFGQLAFATSIVGFFNFFSDFGLTTLGIREIARKKEDTKTLGTNIIVFQGLLTLTLILLLGITLLFMPLDPKLKFITFIYGLGMIPLALDMSYIFQAHEKMEYVLVGKLIGQSTYLILGFILITLFKNIIYLPVSALISGILASLITYRLLRKKISFSFEKIDIKVIKILIIAALPFVTAGVLGNIYHNLDSIMIQFIKNTDQVGYYSSGYKIVNILIMVISFVSNSFFPLIASSYKKDSNSFKKYSLFFSQSVGFIAIPITIGGILYAKSILILLYGSKFVQGVNAFKILLGLVIIIPLNILLSTIIISADRQNHNTISVAIGAGINIILNILLIPQFGIIGAGIATIATEIAITAYLILIHYKSFDFISHTLGLFFIKPIIASAVMVIILLVLGQPNLIAAVPIAAIVYLGTMYLIKGIPQHLIDLFFSKTLWKIKSQPA